MEPLKSLLKSALILIMGVALLTSCVKDKVNPLPGNGNGEITFTIDVPVSAIVKTRSVGTPNENAIGNQVGDFYLFVFTGTTLERAFQPTVTPVSGVTDMNQYSFTGSLAPGAYNIFAVANYPTAITLPAKGTSRTAVEALFAPVEKDDAWDVTAGNDRIPMWGETSFTVTAATTSVPISVRRMVAKINVNIVGATAQADFELRTVSLTNNTVKGYVIPDATKFAGGLPTLNEVDRIVASDEEFLSFTANDATKCIEQIYTFENEKKGEYNDGTDNWLDNLCIIVGGSYKGGTTTYYRLDFIKSDGTWIDNIMRNYCYVFNITAVKGNGFATEEEALKSAPMNMDAGVIDWTDDDFNDISFDGQYSLAVSKSYIELRMEGTAQSMDITTDAEDGWVVESSTKPAWLTISPSSSSTPGRVTINVEATAIVQGSGDRDGVFYVTAGRLRKQITVKQLDIPTIVPSLTYVTTTAPDNVPAAGDSYEAYFVGHWPDFVVRVYDNTNSSVLWVSAPAGIGTRTVVIGGNTGAARELAIQYEEVLGSGTWTTAKTVDQASGASLTYVSTTVPDPVLKAGGNYKITFSGSWPLFDLRVYDQTNSAVLWTSSDGLSTGERDIVINANTGAARTLQLQYERTAGSWITAATVDQETGLALAYVSTTVPNPVSAAGGNYDITFSGAWAPFQLRVYDDTNSSVLWTSSDGGGIGTRPITIPANTGAPRTLNLQYEATSGSWSTATTVTQQRPLVTSITVAVQGGGSASIDVNQTLQLVATVSPSGAIQTVEWTSSATGVATVDLNTGAVTGVASGTVTITATATDGSGVTGTISVTVNKPGPANFNITYYGYDTWPNAIATCTAQNASLPLYSDLEIILRAWWAEGMPSSWGLPPNPQAASGTNNPYWMSSQLETWAPLTRPQSFMFYDNGNHAPWIGTPGVGTLNHFICVQPKNP